jgi:Ras-related protein Rab-1A
MPRQVALKILVLGDGGSGKTTLLHRYVNGEFIDTTTMTIGVEFFTKQITIDSTNVSLILWDITGQDRFRHMIARYMKGASGALILYDMTNMDSFVHVGKWMKIVHEFYENLPIILVAAKYDLEEFSAVDDKNAQNAKEKYKMNDFIKISSKTGLNVDLAVEKLVKDSIKAKNLIAK